MHSHTLVGWAALVLVLLPAVPVWGRTPTLSPDQAVARALTAHPDLRSTQTAVDTARADRSASALFLANPTASGFRSLDGARTDIDVSQPFSPTGEGWHARRAARASVEATAHLYDRRRLTVAAAVRRAYVDAVVATGIVGVALEGADLADRLSFGVRRRHEEGEASTLDLRLARLTEVRAATRLLQARRVQTDTLRRLAAWIAEPLDPTGLLTDPLAVVPEAAGASERSDLLAARATFDQRSAELRRARAATLPPLALGVRVGREDDQTFVGPTLALQLPLFDRNQRARAQSLGDRDVAALQLAQLQAVVQIEQQTANQRTLEANEAAAQLDGTGLEEARAALASIEAGVKAGEIDLATAVLLQTQVLDGEAAAVRLRGLLADARLDQLLVQGDPALLGGAR